MHQTLLRQLQSIKALIPLELHGFINSVNDTYHDYDNQLSLLQSFSDQHNKHLLRINSELNTKIVKCEETRDQLASLNHEFGILFDNIEDILFSFDPFNRKLIQISPACERVYGFTPVEFYNDPDLWEKLILKDDREVIRNAIADLVSGKKVRVQYRTYTKLGEMRWLESKLIPTMGEFGGLVRIDGISSDITERIRAEEKIRENEQRIIESERMYRIIFDNNPLPMWIIDAESLRFLNVNNAAIHSYGYAREEFLELTVSDIKPLDERLNLKKYTQGDGQNIRTMITRHVKKNGEEITVELTRESIIINNKRAFIILVNDISEKVKAEERLLNSKANLRNILENTETGYVLLDTAGKILSFNSTASTMLLDNKSSGLKEGEEYERFVPAKRKMEIRSAVKTVLAEGKPVEYEVLFDSEMGSKWFHVCMHPIVSANNKIIGLSIATTDITKRKISEQMLLKSEANLRTIFDNTDMSYVLLDRTLRVVSCNSKACNSFKVLEWPELREGKNFIDLLPADWRLIARSRYDLVLQGKKMRYEREFILPDNSRRWYSINVFPVSDDLNNILGMIISAEDINSRKFAELEKERITADLIQRNTTLEQFAYIISHNMRSPVANISGLTNLVLNHTKLSRVEFEKCMNGLALSAQKLDEVIIDLNHILHVRRGLEERKELVKFSSIIKDIKTSISSILEKENIIIKTNFLAANELFTVKTYLNSIFYNLISNSIKYRSGSTAPMIEISSKTEEGNLILTFRDNGLGIDLSKNSEKVFGLYRKFHRHAEGKGMGLYMVKTQTELLGGSIKVSSELGKGTEFMITFKREDAPVFV